MSEDKMRSNSKLRGTPAEGLDLSDELIPLIEQGVEEAKKSGQWIRGFAEAATDIKEMGLADMVYWVYKATDPVIKPALDVENVLLKKNVCGLPEGFDKKSELTLSAGGDLLQAEGLELSKDIL